MKILYCRHSILDLEEKIVWFLPVLVRTIIFHQSPNYKGLYNYIWRVKGSNHCCRNTPEMLLFEYRTEVFLSYLSQIKGKWVKTRGKKSGKLQGVNFSRCRDCMERVSFAHLPTINRSNVHVTVERVFCVQSREFPGISFLLNAIQRTGWSNPS